MNQLSPGQATMYMSGGSSRNRKMSLAEAKAAGVKRKMELQRAE